MSAQVVPPSAKLNGSNAAKWESLRENIIYLFVGKTLYTYSYINYVKL